MKKRWLIAPGILILPVLALAVPNPLRTYAPTLFGLHCDGRLCVEEAARLQAARELAETARADLVPVIGAIDAAPRLIFCSTQGCYELFGKRGSRAVSFGDRAVLIGPRGWTPYFVRHELIHIAQYRHLGLYRAWRLPEWLREGMAYSLSADPRRPLPPKLEGFRKQFDDWYAKGARAELWPRLQAEAR